MKITDWKIYVLVEVKRINFVVIFRSDRLAENRRKKGRERESECKREKKVSRRKEFPKSKIKKKRRASARTNNAISLWIADVPFEMRLNWMRHTVLRCECCEEDIIW